MSYCALGISTSSRGTSCISIMSGSSELTNSLLTICLIKSSRSAKRLYASQLLQEGWVTPGSKSVAYHSRKAESEAVKSGLGTHLSKNGWSACPTAPNKRVLEGMLNIAAQRPFVTYYRLRELLT